MTESQPTKRRIWFDTEFIEDGKTIDLISIGLVREDGHYMLLENTECDRSKASQWVKDNVFPHLGQGIPMTREEMASAIKTFAGKSPEFWAYYCVAPETRILTADLQWTEAGSINIGDSLTSFDEFGEPGLGRSSRWRTWKKGAVDQVRCIVRPCYDLEFDDGTRVRCSSDHKWLVSSDKAAKWLETESLRCDGPNLASNVLKPIDVWIPDHSRDAGYLAAALDGEGHLIQTSMADKEAGVCTCRLGFSQKPNKMLDKVKEILVAKGFRFAEGENKISGVKHITIGNRTDVMRCMGIIRPVRLFDAYTPDLLGAMLSKTVKLVSKEFVGNREVVAMSTNTRTFIAEGLASHNCSYDWVALCQLYGTMMDLPEGWPMFCLDLKQEAYLRGVELPKQEGVEHDALADARWNRLAWETVNGVR